MTFFNDLKNHFQQKNFFFQQTKFEIFFNKFIAITI